jgi:succinylglutamate desuccinylase
MNESKTVEKLQIERILGVIEGAKPGPTVVAVGGIHGNEIAGIRALKNVISELKDKADQFCGTMAALCGNLTAIRRGVRYIDEDMNRIWNPSMINEIRQTPAGEHKTSERAEMKNLLVILDQYLQKSSPFPTIFADLHSFSAPGKMIAITSPQKENIDLLHNLQAPLVFGLQEILGGAAIHYYQQRGCITFALEGGRHQDPETVQNIKSSMMRVLQSAGCFDNPGFPDLNRYQNKLAEKNQNLPDQVEFVYQHLIEPGDRFEMRPGYENFQQIDEGEWLAADKHGKIRAKCDGYLLMPLYQNQGRDGFFITRRRK